MLALSIAILLTSLLLYLLPKNMSQHLKTGSSHQHEFAFETVTGIFLQDENATDWATFDYVPLPACRDAPHSQLTFPRQKTSA